MSEEEISQLEEEAESLYKKYCQIQNKITDEKKKNIKLSGLEGKYIKYKDELTGITHYCLVDCVAEEHIRFSGFTYRYMIRGIGFRGRFTGYSDDTFFDWDYSYEFHIFDNSLEGFKKKADNIKVITRDEFIEAFGECVNKVSEFNTKKIFQQNIEKN